MQEQRQVVCTIKLWYHFFLYSPFSNIGGVFRYVRQSECQVRKIAISLQWMDQFLHFWYQYTQYQVSNIWIRLALGKIVYCENTPTYTESHLNSKYAMDFVLKYLQELKEK